MSVFLYHFHGLGEFDLSDLEPKDLIPLQELAKSQDLEILPTVYLRREKLGDLVRLVSAYGELRDAGTVPNIAGFAVEGPLLGPQGGIPRAGRWVPTFAEWAELAGLGPAGLRYIVMAPDEMDLQDEIEPGATFADLITTLYGKGVRLALGHFHRDDPERSARRTEEVIAFLHERYESSRYLILTDHLYNDMPRNFTHAWRTPEQRARHDEELSELLSADWSRENLSDLLGPVPAVVLRAALDDLLIPCINFDGQHVDLEIAGHTAELLGDERLIALTDHTEVAVMAGEPLTRGEHTGLWLRDDGAVAAGASDHEAQRANMSKLGLSEAHVERLFHTNPRAAIDYRPVPRAASAE